MTFAEGTVQIRARKRPNEARFDVAVRSTRRAAVARALTDTDVRTPAPVTLLTSVYSLCPEAHRAAWLAAVDAASETPAPLFSERVKLEAASEHLRFLAFDAPKALGLPPASDLKRIGALRLTAMRTFAAEKPDFRPLTDAIRDAVAAFVTGGPLDHFSATLSLPDLAAWMTHGQTIASRLFAKLWAADLTAERFAAPALSPETPEVAARWLDAPAFDAMAPAAPGAPRMTGAFVRESDRPLIRAVRERYGHSVRTLFAARLTELIALLTDPATRPWVRASHTGEREGTALVECARGLLIHRVRLAKDGAHAERVTIVAPTEWNFAPGGPCEALLAALPAETADEFRDKARWVTTGLDACIPYAFDVTDAAPTETEFPHA